MEPIERVAKPVISYYRICFSAQLNKQVRCRFVKVLADFVVVSIFGASLNFPTSDLDEVIENMQSKDLELSVVSGFDFYRHPMKLLAGIAIAGN